MPRRYRTKDLTPAQYARALHRWDLRLSLGPTVTHLPTNQSKSTKQLREVFPNAPERRATLAGAIRTFQLGTPSDELDVTIGRGQYAPPEQTEIPAPDASQP